MINTAAVMIPGVIIYVNKAKQNAAYQQAVSALDVYEAYQTELDAGLIKLGSVVDDCEHGENNTNGEHKYDPTTGYCTNVLVCGATTQDNNCQYSDDKTHNLKDGKCINVASSCNDFNPSHPGDNIFTSFKEYYFEMTGIKLHDDDVVEGNKFIFNAENGVKVTIDMNDKSAVYGKADK